jgi:ABC-type multidrug transport system ATPase subunit
MTTLSFQRMKADRLGPLQWTLDGGVHAVLGEPADGGAELLALAAGVLRPRRGRVLVDGLQPYRNPALRARIGSLLASERLTGSVTVAEHLARVLGARAGGGDAMSVLAPFHLEHWASRGVETLSPAETRTLALGLALVHNGARLLVLHEPLLAGLPPDQVIRTIEERARAGVLVLSSTSSFRDATLLSAHVRVLDRGRLAGAVAPSAWRVALSVAATDPVTLLSALSTEAAVTQTSWDHDRGSRRLVLRGNDWADLSTAIVRAARSTGVGLLSMAEVDGWAVAPASPDRVGAGR